MSESWGTQVARLQGMASGSPTWDLSDKDREAIKVALRLLESPDRSPSYCDVCGCEGPDLSAPVEVCRDCYDGGTAGASYLLAGEHQRGRDEERRRIAQEIETAILCGQGPASNKCMEMTGQWILDDIVNRKEAGK